MLPPISWSAILELSRMELTPSQQKRLQHLADLKHAAKESKSREQKPDTAAVVAPCCQPSAS